MSIAGISSSDLFSAQSVQKQMQEMRQEFQQLGSDLQSGNLSAAQSDFATLTQLAPSLTSTSSPTSSTSSQTSNPIEQAFAQLAKDLQSGNLSAAQQDFSTIQQDMQSAMAAHGHHHHHHSETSESSQQENPISQLFNQLGQDLQSGNLTAAQQDFTSLQQQFQQNAQNSLQVPPEVGPNAVSVTA